MQEVNINNIEVPNCIGPSINLSCMIDRVNEMPPQNYLFRGIKIPSIGSIFGVPKGGKTIVVESLAYSVAAGLSQFIGENIYTGNNRVLLISLEEYFQSRTERNQKQIRYFTEKYDLDPNWINNVFVVDENFPKHLLTDADWKMLDEEIGRINPTMVMIDSLTRLTIEPIEDSTVATKLMKKLREITYKHNIAMVLIHHTHKMENRPITLATLAGSRVIGQELDFMIGINRTSDNDRYIKDVAYRYASDDSDFVTKFIINEHLVIESLGPAREHKLLEGTVSPDEQNPNDLKLQQYFLEYTQDDISVIIETKLLKEQFVETGIMSGPTLHASLKRLINNNTIWQPEKGKYALKEPS
jgi:archaellum biogenesis ATPase FlaH